MGEYTVTEGLFLGELSQSSSDFASSYISLIFFLPSQMFPWSVVFSLEPKVPGQRTPEELVTNTLMLELGAMVKRTERIRLEKEAQSRRRRNSSSADYSWLAGPQPRVPFELTPGDVLDLQDLCAQIPPQQCGPVIVRYEN